MDVDDILFDGATGENVEENEEIQLTPAQVIQLMEEAWVNEKFAPEILPNKSEIVDCLLEQISHMQNNLESLDDSDLKKGIHQLEVDRLRFLVSSYLRNRIEKIEMYVFHILEKENERLEKGDELYLTQAELIYARNYKQSIENHFEDLLGFYPGLDEWRKQPVVPNMHSFVFLKSKEEIEGIVIDDGGGSEDGDVVDLTKGSQMIISYNSVANLVKNGDVNLI